MIELIFAFLLFAPPFAADEYPIAGRVIRLALRDAGVSEKAASSRLVAAVLDLARGPRGRRLDLPGDVVVSRVADRLEWRLGSPE